MEDVRYPVGKYIEQPFSETQLKEWLLDIQSLPQQIEYAITNLDHHQLNTPYREGGWTVRQVVHHVADSHINAYVRTRLALTEDWPGIKAYDEKLWAELPDARLLPVEVSLEVLAPLHRRWVALFESLTYLDFDRGYRHSENGPQSL